MSLNFKKTIILAVTTAILFYALIDEAILPNVTIPVKDAIIISIFVVISSSCIRFLGMLENKQLESKILQQHAQMQAIINATPLIMYLKDKQGNILLSNKKHAELFDSTPEEIVGTSSYNLYKKNADIFFQEDIDIIKDKTCMVAEKQVELCNGTTGWLRAIKGPVVDTENKITGIVVVLQKIDNEKEIEERKNTFIATLTHDLKTPTIAQIKALDLLLGGSFGELNEEQKDIIFQIKHSCSYMNDLIFTILDTYLYDNGQTKIVFDSFNMPELIQETIGELSHLNKEKNQNIILKCNIKSANIVADRFQIKRVIVNFISNAISYGFKNSDIEVILDETSSEIIFNVKNKARYIPQERLADMYEKFKTTKNAKFRKTGTGLGLYLSKQIIDAHKGKVFAQSTIDETCTFGFSIPKIGLKNNSDECEKQTV